MRQKREEREVAGHSRLEKARGCRRAKAEDQRRGRTLHLKGRPQEGAAGQSIPNFPELHIKTFSTQEILFVYENSLVNSPHCQQSCALISNLQCCMLISFFYISVSITIVDL